MAENKNKFLLFQSNCWRTTLCLVFLFFTNCKEFLQLFQSPRSKFMHSLALKSNEIMNIYMF